MAQLGRSPELTRLMILVILWGHIRLRPGYTMAEDEQPPIPAQRRKSVPKRKGFTVKRPRSRFL